MGSKHGAVLGCLAAVAAGGAAMWLAFGQPSMGPEPSGDERAAQAPATGAGPTLQGVGGNGTSAAAGAPAGPSPTKEGAQGEAQPVLARPATLVVRVVGWRGQPVAGARVSVEGAAAPADAQEPAVGRAATDAHGVARIEGVLRPSVDLQIVADGHEGAGQAAYGLLPGEERHLHVVLHATGTLRGRVVRAADRTPIAGALVHLRSVPVEDLHRSVEWGEYFHDAKPVATDAAGRFAFNGLSLGADHALWVEAAGYERGERGVLLLRPDVATEGATEGVIDVELALRPAGRLKARVIDHLDRPVPEAWVVLVPEEVAARRPVGQRRSSLVDLDGIFVGRAVLACETREEARGPAAGDPLEAALEDPWEGFMCGSWFPAETKPIYAAQTDAAGLAVIDGLGVGRTFRVDPAPRGWLFEDELSPLGNFAKQVADVRVVPTAAAPEQEVTLRLLAPATLRVRGVSAAGALVRGRLHVACRGEQLSACNEAFDEGVFGGLEPGRVEVDLRVSGYAPGRATVELVPGAETLAEVVVTEAEPLRGRVIDERGVPYTQGTVESPRPFMEVVAIGPDGRFELSGRGPGSVRLRVESDEAASGLEVDVLPGEDLVLTLPRGPRGVVLAGLPPGLLLAEEEEEPALSLRPAAEAEGWYALSPFGTTGDGGEDVGQGRVRWSVPPGPYVLTSVVRGCPVLRHRVDVEAGTTVDLGVQGPPALVPVRGEVLLPDGSPAAGAHVRLEGYDQLQVADDQGRVRLAHGPSTPLRALVGGADYVALEQQVEPVPPGGVLRLRATRGAVLEGRVVGERGPASLTLAVHPVDKGARPPRAPPRIDSTERFHVALAPGRYRIELLRAGAALDAAEVTLVEERATSITLRTDR